MVPHTKAAQQQNSGGRGNANRKLKDSCDQAIDQPDKHKQNGNHNYNEDGNKNKQQGTSKEDEQSCRIGGSSSGVAKGDFNNDGFADLAIGVPGEDLAVQDAGAVNVVYGSADGLSATSTSIPAAQFWSMNSNGIPGFEEPGDQFGSALAAGDFNGDGCSDLAIGIPGRTVDGNSGSGAVVIIFGSPYGLTTDTTVSDCSGKGTVPFPLYFDMKNVAHTPLACAPTLQNAHFGASLAWGDFDKDGIGDLVVGVVDYGDSCFVVLSRVAIGAIFVLPGVTSGLLTLDYNNWFIFKGSDGVGPLPFDGFASALAAGDFNGDGASDLAIGVPKRSVCLVFVNGTCSVSSGFAGVVEVIYGKSSFGLDDSGAQIWSQNRTDCCTPEPFDFFGASLAAGDFNGDGKDDLAIGVPGEDIEALSINNTGVVNVFFGSAPPTGLTATNNQFWDEHAIFGVTDEAEAHFGYSLAAGDFNGDGKADLAIGIPFKDVAGVRDSGQVDVIYGAATTGLSSAHTPQAWHQELPNASDKSFGTLEVGDEFGFTLTAWNFGHNENGFPVVFKTADLAVGVPHEDVGTQQDAGAVNVIYGSKSQNGLNAAFKQLFTQNSAGVPGGAEAGDRFGAALY